MKLLSLEKVAERIGLENIKGVKRYLRQKIMQHKIPYSKWGREIMLREEHAEQLIDKVTVWHSGSSGLKTPKIGTSGGRSADARSSKALASIPSV